jgi:hypothetical protein
MGEVTMTTSPRWRKSSRSQNGGTCVELAHTLDAIRDSKSPGAPALVIPGLVAFLSEVKQSRFDR